MRLFSNLFNKNNKNIGKPYNDKIISSIEEQEGEITPVISSVLGNMDEGEIVAVIIAAISIILGTSTDNFTVRKIKRTPELDSIWSIAGRIKLMS